MPKQALHWSLWGFAGMATLGPLGTPAKSFVVQILPALASDALGQALSLQVGFAFPAESGHEAVVFNDGSPAAGTLMLALASDFRSVFSAEVCKEAAKYHKRLSSLGVEMPVVAASQLLRYFHFNTVRIGQGPQVPRPAHPNMALGNCAVVWAVRGSLQLRAAGEPALSEQVEAGYASICNPQTVWPDVPDDTIVARRNSFQLLCAREASESSCGQARHMEKHPWRPTDG